MTAGTGFDLTGDFIVDDKDLDAWVRGIDIAHLRNLVFIIARREEPLRGGRLFNIHGTGPNDRDRVSLLVWKVHAPEV